MFLSSVERLTDNLRAVTGINTPILTQLFLCTRVLIARISAESLASLWFIVMPELVGPKPVIFPSHSSKFSLLHELLSVFSFQLNVFRIFAERCSGGCVFVAEISRIFWIFVCLYFQGQFFPT